MVVFGAAHTNPEDHTPLLTPSVGLGEAARGGGGDLVVGVGLPGDGTVELADVLVLDSGAGGQVHGDCKNASWSAKALFG